MHVLSSMFWANGNGLPNCLSKLSLSWVEFESRFCAASIYGLHESFRYVKV